MPEATPLRDRMRTWWDTWSIARPFRFRSGQRDRWYRAFNGQEGRRSIFTSLLSSLPVQAIIETGTYHAGTAQFLAAFTRMPIFTCENNEEAYRYSKRRLRRRRHVKTFQSDSRKFLGDLAADEAVPKSSVFFYLDAHWQNDLPLREEVDIIARHWRRSVIMIDDFEVPDDAGYMFDDYGPGKRLCLDYLGPLEDRQLVAFFPVLRGEMETGRKRGCVVLTDAAIAPQVGQIKLLRQWPSAV